MSQCVTTMSQYTNATICSACDPVNSVNLNLNSKLEKAYISTLDVDNIKAACGDAAFLNASVVYPYLKTYNQLVNCDLNGQIVDDMHKYRRDACGMTMKDITDCRGNDPVSNVALTKLNYRRRMEGDRKLQVVTPGTDQATTGATTGPTANETGAAPPKTANPVLTVQQENCYNFANFVFRGSIAKVDSCSMGDPDYVRGIYINSLKTMNKLDDMVMTPEASSDNDEKIEVDQLLEKQA